MISRHVFCHRTSLGCEESLDKSHPVVFLTIFSFGGRRDVYPVLLCSHGTYRRRVCNSKTYVQGRFGILCQNEVTWAKASSPEPKYFIDVYWPFQLSQTRKDQPAKTKEQTNLCHMQYVGLVFLAFQPLWLLTMFHLSQPGCLSKSPFLTWGAKEP